MKIIAIPADRMSYKANRNSKYAGEIEVKEDTLQDCLVLLSPVERLDEVNPGLVVETTKREIVEHPGKLKADSAMIFPFAHLTPNRALARAKAAISSALTARTRSSCGTWRTSRHSTWRTATLKR